MEDVKVIFMQKASKRSQDVPTSFRMPARWFSLAAIVVNELLVQGYVDSVRKHFEDTISDRC